LLGLGTPRLLNLDLKARVVDRIGRRAPFLRRCPRRCPAVLGKRRLLLRRRRRVSACVDAASMLLLRCTADLLLLVRGGEGALVYCCITYIALVTEA
jgi:hypothetical protein